MSGTQPWRLASGGRIDREKLLSFTFNGKRLSGYQGDTLASALLANGVRVVGRSFKYHRPRGILAAGAEECNALVTVGQGALEEPNVRATQQPLYDGLAARSQNCWPSVNLDIGRSLDYLHFLWPAGFYNKTFIWPHWHWYEGFIRRMSGLGKLPPEDDPDQYIHRNVHCDVLIVGGGPAGLSAALAASDTATRVILMEQDSLLGGSLLWNDGNINGEQGNVWLEDTVRVLRQRDNVTLLSNTTASAWFDHRMVVAAEMVSDRRDTGEGERPRQRLWKVHPRELVLATGAIEQPLVFADNDRPGIMLASAVQQYCNRYAVTSGMRIVIATNNDSAYDVARTLMNAGIDVVAVIDSRQKPAGEGARAMRDQGITVFQNAIPLDSRGDKGVREVSVAKRSSPESIATLQCDCIAMAGGWQPVVHLFTQARGRLRYDSSFGAFLPDVIPPHVHVAGMVAGALTLDGALEQGWNAGVKAAGNQSKNGRPHTRSGSDPSFRPRHSGERQELEPGAIADNHPHAHSSSDPSFRRMPESSADNRPRAHSDSDGALHIERAWSEQRSARQWIDFQYDVTLQDIDIAVAENYTSVEHMKRYTTAGMSVDQGKTGNLNALLALAERTGRTPAEVGTTTFRPFYLPVTLGALAGRDRGEFYAPVQRSPLFTCHEKLNAQFDDYGAWRRPRVYLRNGENVQQAIAREAVAARTSVAIFDGSPLGKFEVYGPDAAEFLNRIYINNITSLKTGQARYGLMLNENGIIIDDGIFARLAGDHYLVHTTSGGANRIHAWMEALLQGDWPDLDVLLTPVTSQWANVAVSGPRSRELLGRLELGIDFGNNRLPHMAITTGTIDDIPLRVLRAGFTGELCYELNVPADWGAALWKRLLQLGEDLQLMPMGIETLTVLRTEKGYLHVGSDTDGYTTPRDIGWGHVADRKQGDFLGKRSLSRPFNASNGRLEFVGLTPAEEGGVLAAGAHVIDAKYSSAPAPTQGYVTSACYSPNLQRYVGLGLVWDGRSRLGEEVNLYDDGQIHAARISTPAAWDPEGERLHV